MRPPTLRNVIKKHSLLTTSKRASEVQRGVVERAAPHAG